MMILLLVLLSWWPLSAQAAEFAVAQSAAPTSNGGTQDLTSSGFGTPSCALFWGGYGTANNTVVSDAGLWIGAYDGTRQYSQGSASENGQATTDTGSVTDADSALVTLLNTDQTKNGDGTASWITDGGRLTWADAPPSAFLINALLVGGAGVSNCYVGQITSNATVDLTASTTAPGFQPDIIIAFASQVTTHFRPSVGFAWRNGGSVVQRAVGFNDNDAAADAQVSSRLTTNRIVSAGAAGIAQIELTSFDASGITITTRDVGTAITMTYVAIKFNGLNAWLGTSPAPTATGSAPHTGVGFLPQVGLMLQGEFAAVDTIYSGDDGELFGLSAFTSTAAYTSSVYSEDLAATSATESVTDSKVCRTRKDSADYATCTLTSFDADGATYDYTVTNGSARQRAILYVQSSATAGRRRVAPMEAH
jgi:hypothetical protein